MGENICKWCDCQEINLQNIQAAHTLNIKKTSNSIKNGQKISIDISSKKAYRLPKAHEKILNIANY